MTIFRKCKSSATTSLNMWYALPKLLIFFCFFTTFLLTSVSSSLPPPSPISYSHHCDSFVPQSTPRRYSESDNHIHQYHTGYYTGGGSGILSQSPSYLPHDEPPNIIGFNISGAQTTDVQGLFMIQGSLRFQRDSVFTYVGNATSHLRYPGVIYNRSRSISSRKSSIGFKLEGFWSEPSGKLCMVGSNYDYLGHGRWLYVPAVLKLYNLINSTSVTSLISGTLESLVSSENDPSYFGPVSILMLPRMNYEYSLVSNKSDDTSTDGNYIQPSSLPIETFCSVLSRQRRHEFDLKYSSHCVLAKNCTPLAVSDLPRVVSLKSIECSEDKRRLRVLVIFADSRSVWYEKPFNPNTTLVGEGSWDAKKNQIRVVACRILNATESFTNRTHVGDCSTRLSLRFPAVWTIGNTRSTVGKIWGNKTVTELGYFESISFESPENDFRRVLPPGLKYEYTKMETVTKLCPRKKAAHGKTNIYPNPFSYDMRFDMSVKNSKGEAAWGSAIPISVGNWFYQHYPHSNEVPKSSARIGQLAAPVSYSYNNSFPVNISYQISIKFKQLGIEISKLRNSSNSNEVKIYAEGIYDAKEGSLCMVGCRNLGSNSEQPTKDSVDCEILVNFQFPPTNSKHGSFIKGSIKSTRKKSDPLIFETLNLFSASGYLVEAKRSIWRMDVEITLVLLSTTLACVFVALQIFHVKKHPDVRPSISMFMLLILTLGYMIPLMLNFEAMLTKKTNRRNFLLGSGGWLEVNEVIVRVITMVAFLLQMRLLQLTWLARSANGTQKELWIMEKKALFVALSVYVAGALGALLLKNWRKADSENDFVVLSSYFPEDPILDALKSYGGLVLDGFLLPQILLNMFCKSKEKALSVSFYIGTTFVRAMPHAYDLYRAQNSAHHQLHESYLYASPVADFFSTAWDVIIPFGGLLLAGIIYLQQKFGGLCILPQKLRELGEYEKVSTVTEG
ncbi:unnamed protein product [Prunus armeniaca]